MKKSENETVKNGKGKEVLKKLKKPLFILAALILVLILTNPGTLFFLPENAKDKVTELWSSFLGDVTGISKAIHINWISLFKVVVIILFIAFIREVIRVIMGLIHPKSSKGKSLYSLVKSFVTYGAVLVGLVWCLSAIGVNLSTIFASIGIVALVIGFAAESLIEDIITGIFLVFEDEFNVGDIIEIGGFRGTVSSIGIRVTSIQDPGGNVKIVNNSDIRNVLNRSKTHSKATCDVPVSYGADLEKTEEVIASIMETLPVKYPDIFTSVPQYLGVQALDTSSVNLRYVASVSESNIYAASRMMNREVKIGLDRAGIEIPFTQVVVHNADD